MEQITTVGIDLAKNVFSPHGVVQVKLMAPKFVSPYRRSQKNDGNDAEAVCEAVTRPSMRFAPVKSIEQQIAHKQAGYSDGSLASTVVQGTLM